MSENEQNPLADLLVSACAEVWRGNGAIIASGMGVIQRLGASLAMAEESDLMMTDSEAWLVSEPVPIGPRGDYEPQYECWMGFSRIFETIWAGDRHVMIGPSQIDCFGQTNISALGDYNKPKVQMLGVRGLPGNSICHANSFFVAAHSKRVFVEGEVDTVCSIGYNPERLPRGYSFADIDLRYIVTNLAVMDFEPKSRQIRIISLHPGVSQDQVQDNTGFELLVSDKLVETPAPSAEQLALIQRFDPHNLRYGVIK